MESPKELSLSILSYLKHILHYSNFKKENFNKFFNIIFWSILVLMFMFCFVIALICAGIIASPIWVPMLLNNTGKYLKNLIEDHPEKIEGEIVEITEIDETFLFPFQIISFNGENQPLQTYEPLSIHRYVLTLKKGVELIKIRIPFNLYIILKIQIKKGQKYTSLMCEKNPLENVYDFYDKDFMGTVILV